jgi:hypothetical protein
MILMDGGSLDSSRLHIENCWIGALASGSQAAIICSNVTLEVINCIFHQPLGGYIVGNGIRGVIAGNMHTGTDLSNASPIAINNSKNIIITNNRLRGSFWTELTPPPPARKIINGGCIKLYNCDSVIIQGNVLARGSTNGIGILYSVDNNLTDGESGAGKLIVSNNYFWFPTTGNPPVNTRGIYLDLDTKKLNLILNGNQLWINNYVIEEYFINGGDVKGIITNNIVWGTLPASGARYVVANNASAIS